MEAWLQLAAGAGVGRVERVAPGRVVFARDDAADEAFVLLEGCVEVVHERDDGRSLVVKLLVAPTMFGIIELFGGERRYLESVRPLVGSRLWRLPRDRFLELNSGDTRLALATLADTARAFCSAARAEPASLASVDALLARLFLAYADLFGRPQGSATRIALRRTQDDFAQSVGASERQVQRLLVDWKRQGIIGKADGYYLVRRRAALETIAGDLGGSLVHPPPM